MSAVLGFILTVVACLLLIPTGMIFLETLLARPRRRRFQSVPDDIRCVLLVPAHNESKGIAKTLEKLKTEALPENILVIADNCSDDTADIARAAGVSVIERQHDTNKGKGFALHFGVQYLMQNPPDYVLIIDADCYLKAGSHDRLVATAIETGLPVQARYEMDQPSGKPSPGQVISDFAWQLMNVVRKQGLDRLGAPTRMNGTGMCLPWAAVGAADLNHGHLVEDLIMGLELAEKGFPGIYCDGAIVRSEFPQAEEGEVTQRQRWEHGTLQVIKQSLPALAKKAITKPSVATLAHFGDMTVPPIILLMAAVTVMCSITGLFWIFTGQTTSLGIALISAVLIVLALSNAYLKIKDNLGGKLTFGAIWKFIGLKLKVYNPSQKDDGWVRTSRDESNTP